MSDSVYERLHEALAELLTTELEAIYGSGQVFIERNRDSRWQSFPAVTILDGGLEPEPEKSGVASYVATPIIEGFCAATTSGAACTARNQLFAEVVRIIKREREALIEGFGEGLVDIREGSTEVGLSRVENQGPVAYFSLIVEVEFWTEANDPFAPGPDA